MIEYTPSAKHLQEAYEYWASGCGGSDGGEVERFLAVHDREVREQIAQEIEHKREVLSEAQLRSLGHLPPVQSGIVAGYTYAARIARGERP